MHGSTILAALMIMMAARSTRAGAAGATPPTTDASTLQAPAGGARSLVAPVLRLLGTLGIPVEDPSPLPNCERVVREQGWREIHYPLRDVANGVYLEVRGRVEFDRAEVRLADGTLREVALHHAMRGNGLYALWEFGAMTRVESVVIWVRARSAEAGVGARLGY